MITKQTRHELRVRKIHFLYKYELLNEPIDLVDAFENYNFSSEEVKELEELKNEYPKLKATITKYISKSWTWERLNPLERAILLLGTFEFKTLDKKIVINEMIIYAKEYLLDNKYKYINAILEKTSNYGKEKL